MLLGVFLFVPPAEAKSKKRKRRAPNKTEQTQAQKVNPTSEEQKVMDLEARCMSYCDFTTQCLESIRPSPSHGTDWPMSMSDLAAVRLWVQQRWNQPMERTGTWHDAADVAFVWMQLLVSYQPLCFV